MRHFTLESNGQTATQKTQTNLSTRLSETTLSTHDIRPACQRIKKWMLSFCILQAFAVNVYVRITLKDQYVSETICSTANTLGRTELHSRCRTFSSSNDLNLDVELLPCLVLYTERHVQHVFSVACTVQSLVKSPTYAVHVLVLVNSEKRYFRLTTIAVRTLLHAQC